MNALDHECWEAMGLPANLWEHVRAGCLILLYCIAHSLCSVKKCLTHYIVSNVSYPSSKKRCRLVAGSRASQTMRRSGPGRCCPQVRAAIDLMSNWQDGAAGQKMAQESRLLGQRFRLAHIRLPLRAWTWVSGSTTNSFNMSVCIDRFHRF